MIEYEEIFPLVGFMFSLAFILISIKLFINEDIIEGIVFGILAVVGIACTIVPFLRIF